MKIRNTPGIRPAYSIPQGMLRIVDPIIVFQIDITV
jgi:hypothetical protein